MTNHNIKKKQKILFLFLFISLFFILLLLPELAFANDACSITTTECLNPIRPTFWLVTTTALIDAINPCAIAVLLLLLSALIFFDNKKRVLFGGLAFVAGLYITYFLFGLGIFYTLGINQWVNPGIFHKVVGVFGIVIGLLNIKDFFWYGGGGFVMEIPRRIRPKMSLIIAKATSPLVAFFTGMLITLFELPCTGGPYVFILGVLSSNIYRIVIIPILIYYNLIFILPLLVILLGVYIGFLNIEKAEQWKQRNLKLLHLIAGVLLVALGIWVFFS